MIEETLKSIGLNDKEIAIYLAIIKVGSAPASVLGKRTGITRSTAQYVCQQLAHKGLLSVIQKNNTFIYSPEPPEKLLYLIDQQKQELDTKHDQVNRIIGDLRGMINPHATMPKVKFFEGVDGLIEMFEDVLKEKAPFYGAFWDSKDIHPGMEEYWEKRYYKKRAELGIPSWALFNMFDENTLLKKHIKENAQVDRLGLVLPSDQFPFNACVNIYANKVAFYSYLKNDMTGILIENEHIYNTQLSMFKLAWNYARTLKANKQYKDIKL